MLSTFFKKITGSSSNANPYGDDAYDAMDSTLPLLYLDESKLPEHWAKIENHPPRDQGFPVVSMKALLAPHRQMLIDIKHNLRLDEDKYKRLFDPVLLRFMDFVYNLPSSQFNHHAGPGGALHHALQVARQCSQVASKYTLYKMRGGPTMSPEKIKAGEQYARLAITIAGLLHDVGKPLTDLRVSLERPGNGQNESEIHYWPAQQMGLRSWLIEMKATEYFITFRPGRGTDHKKIGRGALERFITPAIRQEFDNVDQSFLPRICDALDCVNPDDDHFVRIVMEADNRSAAQDAAASEQRRTDRRTGLPVVHATLNSIAELVNRDPTLINDRGAILWNTDEGLFIDIEKAYPKIKKYRINELGQSFPVTKEVLIEDLVNGEYCQLWDKNENATGPYWPVTPSVLVKGRDPNSFHLWLLKLSDKSHIPTDLPHVVSATIVPASTVYKNWKKKDEELQSKLTGAEKIDLGDDYDEAIEAALNEGDKTVAQVPVGEGADESVTVDTSSGEIVSTEQKPTEAPDVAPEQSPTEVDPQPLPSSNAIEKGALPSEEKEVAKEPEDKSSSDTPASGSADNMMDALQSIGDDLPMPFDMGPGDTESPFSSESSEKKGSSETKSESSEPAPKKEKPAIDASALNLAPGSSSGGNKKSSVKKAKQDSRSAASNESAASNKSDESVKASGEKSSSGKSETSSPKASQSKEEAPAPKAPKPETSDTSAKPQQKPSMSVDLGPSRDSSANGTASDSKPVDAGQSKQTPKPSTDGQSPSPPEKRGSKEPDEKSKQRSAIKSVVKGPRTYEEVKAQEQSRNAGRKTPRTREDAWKIVKNTLQPYGKAGTAVTLRLSEVIDGDALVGQTWFFHNKKFLAMAYPDCFKGMSESAVSLKDIFEKANVLICDSKYPHKAVWEIDGVLGIMFNEKISQVVSDLIKLAEFDRDPFAEPPDPARKYHGRKKTASQKKQNDLNLAPPGSEPSGPPVEKAHKKDMKTSPKPKGIPENSQSIGASAGADDEFDPTDIDSIIDYLWRHIRDGHCRFYRGYSDDGAGHWTLSKNTFRAVTAQCPNHSALTVRSRFKKAGPRYGYQVKSLSDQHYITALGEGEDG